MRRYSVLLAFGMIIGCKAEKVETPAASSYSGEQIQQTLADAVPSVAPASDLALEGAVGDRTVTVYKSPTCSCCAKWITHLEGRGFKVVSVNTGELPAIKAREGVPGDLHSCHTAKVGGYVVEGHVPARDIERMLTEKPSIKGLAVGGMPRGSPGMEAPVNDRYNVTAFGADGKRSVWASY